MPFSTISSYNCTLVQRLPGTRHGKLNMFNDLAEWSEPTTYISYSVKRFPQVLQVCAGTRVRQQNNYNFG